MDALLLSVRCTLAAVFGVAAIGKLLDLDGSRRALAAFGVPARLARVGGVALPVAELAVAIALLILPSARWGGAAALLLLVAFAAGVARAMARGHAPDCHCFGQIHSEPAGRSTLIRNAILAAGAALVLAAGPGPSLNGGLASLRGAEIALVAVSVFAALVTVAAAQLWADRRRLARQLAAATSSRTAPGVRRGTWAPNFDLIPLRGTTGSLTELMSRLPTARPRPAALVFVSTSCAACVELLPSLGRWQESLAESLTLVAIFAGEREEIERLCDEHELSLALAQKETEVFELYRLRVTPSAVLVGFDGIVAGAPAEGVPAIEALIRSAVAEQPPLEAVAEPA